jgi:predicted RNA binding protein YcfA (HicA-like mRNA interferase family)
MPKLKRLSGKEVITILRRFGFEETSQKGSHVKWQT